MILIGNIFIDENIIIKSMKLIDYLWNGRRN